MSRRFFPIHRETSPEVKTFPSWADSPKGAGGESSSLDEDSSDALSPDQPANHDSPLSAVPQLSPCDVLSQNGDVSPSQVLAAERDVNPILRESSNRAQFVFLNSHHAVNRSTVSSVHHAVAPTAAAPAAAAAPPGERLRLPHVWEINKWTVGDLGKLALLHRSQQGAPMFVLSLSLLQTLIGVMNKCVHSEPNCY